MHRSPKKREERETVKSAQLELCIPFTTYNKDEVPVDVATSLVVNHINIGVLCLFGNVCAYVYGEVTDLR